MAKSNNKTKNGGWKFLAIALAVVFVAVFLVAGFGSSWFKNGDISTWFNDWGKGDQTDKDDLISSSLVVNGHESNGISLAARTLSTDEYEEYGVSEQAETAITIAVTIEPSDATDKTITASTAFKDASSTWADGKIVLNYVETAVKGQSVTVTCNAAFGEQIILTIGTSNPDVNATVSLDYVKRVNSVDVTLSKGAASVSKFNLADNATYTASVTPAYSDGTLAPNISATYTLFINSNYGACGLNNLMKPTTGHTFTSTFSNTEKLLESLFTTWNNYEVSDVKAQMARNTVGIPYFSIKADYTATYGGKTISSGNKEKMLSVDASALKISVTGANTDQSNVTF